MRLGEQLKYLAETHPIVLGLPRGGVPVAAEVAAALGADLDVIVVRKIGAPYQPELAIGALAEGGELVMNDELVSGGRIETVYIYKQVEAQQAEVDRRAKLFRRGRPALHLKGRTVIVVDDGLATGMSATAAVRAVRKLGAKRIILAVPVCAEESAESIAADEKVEVVCAEKPRFFRAVGCFYDEFEQVTDREVIEVLKGTKSQSKRIDQEVSIDVGGAQLTGKLTIPPDAVGIVAFAHGSGSSRFSPRNQQVAETLNDWGIGTLLLDLLTPVEEQLDAKDRKYAFDIRLLGARMCGVVKWLRSDPHTSELPIGLFGASTGAAAALVAAAHYPESIRAVVSRGGRPDLADDSLYGVSVPTLLIVGGHDDVVIKLNEIALSQIPCPDKKLEIVPGATHLFEEPGALAKVVDLTVDWFSKHFARVHAPKVSMR